MFSTVFVNACILIRLYNFFPDSVHVYFVSIFCIIVKETLSWSLTFNSRFPCNHTHNNLSASRTRVIKVSCSILNNTLITHIVTFSFQISFNLPCISHFQTLLGQQAQRSSFPGSSSARKLLHMFSIFHFPVPVHLPFGFCMSCFALVLSPFPLASIICPGSSWTLTLSFCSAGHWDLDWNVIILSLSKLSVHVVAWFAGYQSVTLTHQK